MFDLVPEEAKLKQFTWDDTYEYAEVRFSHVYKSLLIENSRLLPSMEDGDPRIDKITQILSYHDSLAKAGWESFETVIVSDFAGEIKRFRRKK